MALFSNGKKSRNKPNFTEIQVRWTVANLPNKIVDDQL